MCAGHTNSEVGGRQRVCGVAILTDDGGGVSFLAVVVTSASDAGYLADGGCEDHLDPAGVVARCCCWKHGGNQEDREGEQREPGYSLIHRKVKNFQVKTCHDHLPKFQSKQQEKSEVFNPWELQEVCPPSNYWCLSVPPPSSLLLNPVAPLKCEEEERKKRRRGWQTKLGLCPVLHDKSLRCALRSISKHQTGDTIFSFSPASFPPELLQFNFRFSCTANKKKLLKNPLLSGCSNNKKRWLRGVRDEEII